jgi:transcription initiation factor TFIID subunit 1
MPHAVGEEDLQAEQDDEAIRKLLEDDPQGDTLDFLARDLDVGEKADDAIDFEDIGDDDLADDEDETNNNRINGDEDDGLAGLFSDPVEGHDDTGFDDLFGDDDPSTFGHDFSHGANAPPSKLSGDIPPTATGGAPTTSGTANAGLPTFGDVEYGTAVDEEEEDEATREQRLLFEMSRRDNAGAADLPPVIAVDPDVFEQVWPDFETGRPLRFAKIIPHKRAFFVAKTPLKPPKPIQPTKVNLEIQQDQERSFRLPENLGTRKAPPTGDPDERGIIVITDGKHEATDSSDEIELEDLDYMDENEIVGGVSFKDLTVICQDWDIPTPDSMSIDGEAEGSTGDELSNDNEWIRGMMAPPSKV